MEKERFYNEFISPNLPKNKKEWVLYILIILIVVTLGLVGVNNYLEIQYKATLIQNPCKLCEDFQYKMKYGFDKNLIDLRILNYSDLEP